MRCSSNALVRAGVLGVLFGAALSCTADDAATADAGTLAPCVNVTGSGSEPWLDLRVAGREFQTHEDLRIRVAVASGGRVAVAHDTIVDAGFELMLPGAINYGYYPEIALYVDSNVDDSCDAGEPLWGVVTGVVQDNVVLEVTPDQVCVRNGGPQIGVGCRAWLPPTDVCLINGATDLEAPLSCSP